MAEGLRRSERTVKINRRAEFLYDEESVNALYPRSRRNTEVWQQRSSTDSVRQATSGIYEGVNVEAILTKSSADWSVLDYLINIPDSNNTCNSVATKSGHSEERRSQSQLQNSPLSPAADEVQFVVSGGVNNIEGPSSWKTVNTTAFRRNSSTRWDYLDLDCNFLSVSSVGRTESSDMGDSDE